MNDDAPRAPAGWGFVPQAAFHVSPADLPELPLLRVLRPEDRARAVRDAIAARPDVARVIDTRDVLQAYPLLNMKAAAHALWDARAAGQPPEWRL